jgi:hypothetical protein
MTGQSNEATSNQIRDEDAEPPPARYARGRAPVREAFGMREMKAVAILSLVLMVGAGCRNNRDNFNPLRHAFLDESAGSANAIVLTSTQASHLLTLVRNATPDEARAFGRADPSIPRPQLAPSLCVSVYDDGKKTKHLGQILGYERKWIVTADKVISETNTVEAVYRAVGR